MRIVIWHWLNSRAKAHFTNCLNIIAAAPICAKNSACVVGQITCIFPPVPAR